MKYWNWIVVCIDILFMLMSGCSLADDINKLHPVWMIMDCLLTFLWGYWFMRDTQKIIDMKANGQ